MGQTMHSVSAICAINYSSSHTPGQIYKFVYLMPFWGVELVRVRADLNDEVLYQKYIMFTHLNLCSAGAS